MLLLLASAAGGELAGLDPAEIAGESLAGVVYLIVMGSHHPELKDYLLGPNAAKVMRHADCSVMVVRE